MSERKSVSPLLDGFTVGSPVNEHFGVCCYPAVKADTDRKYILKVISIPASQTQLEALLITGAYKDTAEAAEYFRSLTDNVIQEVAFLRKMARLKGFLPFEGLQYEPMGKNLIGYNVYLLSGFRLSLERYMHRQSVTHLEAVNLGIDLCDALAACRKEGMLYIDLKPSNIFISTKKEYKIGDIGFVPLASLKYSSMPAKYRSRYSPPEVLDDLAVLNKTVDTYAVGMILYQLFNNGVLPADVNDALPAPRNADEEIAKIILKACAPNPEDRWSDPGEMGQALIDYMQVGTINDTPIMAPITRQRNAAGFETSRFAAVGEEPAAEAASEEATLIPQEPVSEEETQMDSPPAPEEEPDAPTEETPTEEAGEEPAAPEEEPVVSEEAPAEPGISEELPLEESSEAPAGEPVEAPSEAPCTASEDILGDDLLFTPTETTPDDLLFTPMDTTLDELLFAPMENPADDLFFAPAQTMEEKTNLPPTESPVDGTTFAAPAAPAEQSVPAPEAVPDTDSTITAERIEAAAAEEFAALSGQNGPVVIDEAHLDSELQAVQQILSSEAAAPKPPVKKHPHLQPVVIEEQTQKKKSPVPILVTMLVICLLIAAGIWGYLFYQTEYLKTVNDLSVTGDLDEMTVVITSEIPDNLLNVTCTDTYGHVQRTYVRDGKATFTGLSPDSLYKIQVEVNGAHKLVGKTTEIFTTESVTNVVSFTVYAGQEDGSAIINLMVDGHEPDLWQVIYTAEGEPELGHTFSGHTAQVNNLVLGKKYTFRLETAKHESVNGQTTAELTASRLILPNNLAIVSCLDGQMVVRWSSTEAAPSGWRAYCYGENYDQVLECTETEAIFTGIEAGKAYTVEVKANGMGQGSEVSITANPITVTDLQVDVSDPQELLLSWEFEGQAPESGWVVQYTLDDGNLPSAVRSDSANVSIGPRIPGATYHFTIQAADDTTVLGGLHSYSCPAAENFSGFALTSASITSQLLVTPETEGWLASTIDASAYTTNFTVGQPVSMILRSRIGFNLNEESVHVLFVFRDQNGSALAELISEVDLNWKEMWIDDDYHYAELNIPVSPTRAGSYTLTMYINGAFFTEAALTVF